MTETGEAARSIELEARIQARPESVWRAWADPAGLAEWFVTRASGRAEPGGSMTWHWDAFGLAVDVRVREARAPERLVLEVADPTGGFHVLEIRIAAGSGGATRLRIVESGFGPDDPNHADSVSGWTLALGVLRHALERHAGEERGELLVLVRAGEAPPIERYATLEGLRGWLVNGAGEVPGAGEFDGECTAMSRSEALWTWPARSGVLELKSFGAPGAPMIGVRMSAWGAGREALDALRPALEDAVARLRGVLAVQR